MTADRTKRTCLAVILAAGESTRMKSSRSKVLHPVAGQPMIAHVVEALAKAGISDIALVLGRDAEKVEAAARNGAVRSSVHIQTERLGTAHAVLAAREAIARGYDDVLVVFGDTPLITETPLIAAREGLASGADVVVIGFRTADPTGYGRLVIDKGELLAIREHKDASEAERAITYCNGGLMAIDGRKALDLIEKIGNANIKGEYYLTDIVEVARAAGGRAIAVEAPEEELTGCNTRAELAVIERLWQQRRRHEMMRRKPSSLPTTRRSAATSPSSPTSSSARASPSRAARQSIPSRMSRVRTFRRMPRSAPMRVCGRGLTSAKAPRSETSPR